MAQRVRRESNNRARTQRRASRNNSRRPQRYQRRKNRVVAAFLALFFGMFGVHKFYLNRSGEGMIFLFIFFMFTSMRLFSMPLTLLLGLFDAMRLFFMSNEEFDAKYNGIPIGTVEDDIVEEQTRRRRKNTAPRRNRNDRPVRSTSRTRKNPFKLSGARKYKEYDVDGAIKDFVEALNVSPKDPEVHFMLGKAYSLNEEADKSYYHLSKAMDYGYRHPEKILEEDDFAFLRIDPDFDEFKTNGYKAKPKSIKTEEPKDDVLLSQMNKLAELRRRGLLSESEYIKEKEKLMNG